MSVSREVRPAEHFSWAELDVSGRVPDEYAPNALALAAVLESLRALWGARPIRITSVYRTPERNRAVGGSPTSQHLRAAAADVVVSGATRAEIAQITLAAAADGRLPLVSQVIMYGYTDHVHVGLADPAVPHTRQLLYSATRGSYSPMTVELARSDDARERVRTTTVSALAAIVFVSLAWAGR